MGRALTDILNSPATPRDAALYRAVASAAHAFQNRRATLAAVAADLSHKSKLPVDEDAAFDLICAYEDGETLPWPPDPTVAEAERQLAQGGDTAEIIRQTGIKPADLFSAALRQAGADQPPGTRL